MSIAVRHVPIIRIPYSEDDHAFIRAGIDEVLDSGQLTSAKYTRRFEEEFAAFTGAKFAVATTNCTAALELIFRSLGLEGISVIVPTNTFLASAFSAIHAGNRVIFADSDPATLCLDVDDVERRIESDTRAVMLVHIGGVIAPAYQRLRDLCEQRGLYLIEDCAHAHGSTIDGRQAGTLGVAGAFSFFPTKVLTTGEGGVLVTDDEDLYQQALMIRNHGKNPDLANHISEIGHNFRMSEITAVLGVEQMRKAEQVIAERRAIARFYDGALARLEGVQPLAISGSMQSSYYKYVAYLDGQYDRAVVKEALKDGFGVSLTGEVYEDLCHSEPVWDSFTLCGRRRAVGEVACDHSTCQSGRDNSGYPGAEYLSKRHICLPLYPGLAESEREYVVDSLETVLRDLRAA